jgi:hypothetical protein
LRQNEWFEEFCFFTSINCKKFTQNPFFSTDITNCSVCSEIDQHQIPQQASRRDSKVLHGRFVKKNQNRQVPAETRAEYFQERQKNNKINHTNCSQQRKNEGATRTLRVSDFVSIIPIHGTFCK